MIAPSHLRAMVGRMEVTTSERAEGWARLQGLMAVLALPPVRRSDNTWARPPVEVEIAPGNWTPVEDIVIDADGMTLSFGKNGSRVEYRFPGTTCPRWRVAWDKDRS